MRLGVTLPPGHDVEVAVAAEASGIPFVHVVAAPGTESAIAATVATATWATRVLVSVHLGHEHPVTIAEEIAVLDNVSNGRIGVIAELGSLDADDAAEDVAVLRASWSGRPLAHHGRRWHVPAGLAGHTAPASIMVTPSPSQLEMPLWVAGASAGAVARTLGVPHVADAPADVDDSQPVAPARAKLTGDLDADRRIVLGWSANGATHLLCELTGSATLEALARWLVPEVAMVGFPRVVAESPLPAVWPRRNAVEARLTT